MRSNVQYAPYSPPPKWQNVSPLLTLYPTEVNQLHILLVPLIHTALKSWGQLLGLDQKMIEVTFIGLSGTRIYINSGNRLRIFLHFLVYVAKCYLSSYVTQLSQDMPADDHSPDFMDDFLLFIDNHEWETFIHNQVSLTK